MSQPLPEGGGLIRGEQLVQRERMETSRQLAYETAVVKRILRRTPPEYVSAVHEAAKQNGTPLCFSAFHEGCPDFPVRLGSAKIPYVHTITVPSFFRTMFTKTPIFQAYVKWLVTENLDDRQERVCFVFQWPGISDMAVLHNFPVGNPNVPDPDLQSQRGTRIVRPYGNPLVIYVLEALDDFLDNLAFAAPRT